MLSASLDELVTSRAKRHDFNMTSSPNEEATEPGAAFVVLYLQLSHSVLRTENNV